MCVHQHIGSALGIDVFVFPRNFSPSKRGSSTRTNVEISVSVAIFRVCSGVPGVVSVPYSPKNGRKYSISDCKTPGDLSVLSIFYYIFVDFAHQAPFYSLRLEKRMLHIFHQTTCNRSEKN